MAYRLNIVKFSDRIVTTSESIILLRFLDKNLSGRCGIVGLDIEWRPNLNPKVHYNNPVATIQLCIGDSCLIFQILLAKKIPSSLASFLNSPYFTFVGVGVEEDGEKLLKDYGLRVANVVDLHLILHDRSMYRTRVLSAPISSSNLKSVSKLKSRDYMEIIGL